MEQSLLRVVPISLVGVFCLTSVAVAEPPTYRRDTPRLDIQVRQTERTKGLAARTASKKKKKKAPRMSADRFINIQGKIKHLTAKQIAEFKKLIEDTDKSDPELPDLYFRLAELYSGQQRYWRFRAMEMYEKIRKAANSQRSRLKSKQRRYFAEEQKFLKEAIATYAIIARTKRFTNYPRMDEALFYYAYTLHSAKRTTLSRKIYHQLIKNYPNSRYIPDALFSFAEYFFEKDDLQRAEQFYDKVLEFPKAGIYAFAMYKKGWVYLNQDRSQDALETFFKVSQLTNRGERNETLNKASKRDFVRAYADVGRTQRAYQAFRRVDKGYAFTMLKILAGIYYEQGKAKKAIFAYRQLMTLGAKEKQVCEWQGNIVVAMLGVGTPSQKVSEIENLVKLYRASKSKGILKGAALAECRENASATSSEMARLWHNEALSTLNADTFVLAERLYRVWMASFKAAKDFGEMQYYYADLLWKRADLERTRRLKAVLWEKTAVAFTDVVKAGRVNDKLIKEAAYAAVLAWKNALAVVTRTNVDGPTSLEAEDNSKIPTPKPIDGRQKQMIDAFDIYIHYIKNPNDDDLVVMKFLKARVYWRHDHLAVAIPMFAEIVDKHLEHEVAEYSINILLDSLRRMKRFRKMVKRVDSLLAKKQFLADKPELHANLKVLKLQSMRKEAERLAATGKYIQCGQAFVDIYNWAPDQQKGDEVLYNAGDCFEKGKSIGLAILAFESLSQRFPKSKHTQKALVRMGNAYGAIAYYEKAATKYEAYAKNYGGEQDASAALSNAVLYRMGIGQDDKAIKNIEFFARQYKTKLAKQAADAMFGMTGIYEKRGRSEAVIKHLQRYLKQFGKTGGRDRVVIANAKMGQLLWKQSCKGRGVAGACVKVVRERALRERKHRRRKGAASLPSHCGEVDSKIKLTVLKRDRRRAAQAKAYFVKAIAAYKGAIGNVPGKADEKAARTAATIYWYAAAKFYLAEESYESFLDVAFPRGLDFSVKNKKKAAKSTKDFTAWLDKKKKLGEKANDSYKQVREIRGGGAAWAIAGAARIGQISQTFADALHTAEVPKDVRTGPFAEEAWDIYCDTVTSLAEPLEDRSIAAFTYCLEKSTQLNWFNRWSKMCERELGQIRPQTFPTASEVHAQPNNVAAITDTQDPILKLN